MGELTQNRSASPDPLDAARYRSATLALRGCRRWCAPYRRLQRLPLPCAWEKINGQNGNRDRSGSVNA